MTDLNRTSNIKASRQPGRRIGLFWKILVWFWLSLVVILTVNLFIGYLNSGRAHYFPLPPPANQDLSRLTEHVQRILESGDTKRLSSKRFVDIYLLDAEGNDLLQQETPQMLLDLHSRVKRAHAPLSVMTREAGFFGGSLVHKDEHQYWLYSSQRLRRFDPHLFTGFWHEFSRSLLISTFVISFPLSFVLSWLITGPIRRLQRSTHQLKHNLGERDELLKLQRRRDEFGELARDFDDLAGHLERLLAAQRQLVSDVSHELRSPLSRMQVALAIAEQHPQEPERGWLARIQLESKRMNLMLENLLTLSRLEAQEAQSEFEWLDLAQLLKMVTDDGRFEAEQQGIEISLQVPAECHFYGVKEALLSGFENILRNAIRYAGAQGHVECQLTADERSIQIHISDSGPGVAQDQLDKIFDAFYRPEKDRARHSGGVGLGLAIAKRAFALNGATITAENLVPHGLSVTVTLPIRTGQSDLE